MIIRPARLLSSAALASVALSTPITSSADVVIACMNKTNGGVRVVTDAVQCQNSEVPISWNAEGLPGPAGPTGPAGPAGPTGPTGTGIESLEPIVVTEPLYGWAPLEPEAVTILGVGTQNVLFRSNGQIGISLSGPASIAGNNYRLASVEYCVEFLDDGARVVGAQLVETSPGQPPTLIVDNDNTFRTEPGCYSLTVTGGRQRSRAFVLFFNGPGDARARLSVARSTWVLAD